MSNILPGFQRLYQTPIREIVRLRLNGRLNWRAAIAQSGLPTEIRTLIHAVVRKTGLMRFEKAAVTNELVGHFQDGHLMGKSYATLIKDFGDIQVASTLIRRSKIRNRPMYMKLTKVLGWGSLGMLASYLGMLIFFHSGRPMPKIDFLPLLNQRQSEIAEDEKAWPIYRDAWIKHKFCERGCPEIYHDLGGVDQYGSKNSRLVKPGDPEWESAIQFLESKRDLIAVLRKGSKCSALGLEVKSNVREYDELDRQALFANFKELEDGSIDVGWGLEGLSDKANELTDGSLIGIRLPHVQTMRSASKLFRVDTRLAVVENDNERALDNLLAIFGFANQASDTPFLVGGLVSIAVCRQAFDQIEEIVMDDPNFFTDAQLAELQRRIGSISMRDFFDLESEKFGFEDIAQRIFTDNGRGDGRITPEGLEILAVIHTVWKFPRDEKYGLNNAIYDYQNVLGPASVFTIATRKESIDKYHEIFEHAKSDFDKPFWANDDPFDEASAIANSSKYQLIDVLLPSFSSVHLTMEKAIARQNGLEMAIAIHRYRQANDQWPESFEQLAPDFIDEIPQDRMTGGLVNFKIVDDVPVIYGNGADRDDDGGKPIFWSTDVIGEPRVKLMPGNTSEDGDWILWPQEWPFPIENAN